MEIDCSSSIMYRGSINMTNKFELMQKFLEKNTNLIQRELFFKEETIIIRVKIASKFSSRM